MSVPPPREVHGATSSVSTRVFVARDGPVFKCTRDDEARLFDLRRKHGGSQRGNGRLSDTRDQVTEHPDTTYNALRSGPHASRKGSPRARPRSDTEGPAVRLSEETTAAVSAAWA